MSNHEGMEIPKIENPPISIPIEMYQVSGHGDPDSKKYLRDKKQDNLIRSAAKKYGLLDKIQNAPEQERVLLIKQALSQEDPSVQREAARMIRYAPEQEQVSLWLLISEKIKQALFQKDPTVQREAAMIIWYAPAQEQVSLIKQALSQKDPAVQREAAAMIVCAPAQERVSLQLLISEKIKQALSQEDPAVQREAAGMIRYAPTQEQVSLIKQALSQKDPSVQREAAVMIECAPAQERVSLQLLISEKIKQALSQKDPTVQREAAEMIWYVPRREIVSLQLLISEKIKQALSQEDPAVQREAVGMIRYAPAQKRISLVKIASDAGLGNEIVKPPLYYNSNLDRGRFKREKFHKTGSETTLVGGALKDKLIIRHIKPRAFLAWQKIYENYQVWQDNGFDYVPIEPIQSYRLNKKGMVDVFSGVLDLSLAEWSEISGNIFIKELEEQRDKIISILESQGIRHGHTHDNNFVLRFFRDQDGNPDLTKVPRLYAIDFDMAVSP
ncbi:MAG: hypothetical protein A2301_02040 [Candidatus Magasanikbacteria bacterium RIFOXYB2_FULL_40_13]|nr:MAG: hypothetical protein A2301_02040 [Candidatus Magasanikbacteria bacterium RIFOXYB2_FULL_40_13]